MVRWEGSEEQQQVVLFGPGKLLDYEVCNLPVMPEGHSPWRGDLGEPTFHELNCDSINPRLEVDAQRLATELGVNATLRLLPAGSLDGRRRDFVDLCCDAGAFWERATNESLLSSRFSVESHYRLLSIEHEGGSHGGGMLLRCWLGGGALIVQVVMVATLPTGTRLGKLAMRALQALVLREGKEQGLVAVTIFANAVFDKWDERTDQKLSAISFYEKLDFCRVEKEGSLTERLKKFKHKNDPSVQPASIDLSSLRAIENLDQRNHPTLRDWTRMEWAQEIEDGDERRHGSEVDAASNAANVHQEPRSAAGEASGWGAAGAQAAPGGTSRSCPSQPPLEPRSGDGGPPTGPQTGEARVCSICLESIEAKSIGLPCSHSFHDKCIDKWVRDRSRAQEGHGKCPNCRREIEAMYLLDANGERISERTVPEMVDAVNEAAASSSPLGYVGARVHTGVARALWELQSELSGAAPSGARRSLPGSGIDRTTQRSTQRGGRNGQQRAPEARTSGPGDGPTVVDI